MSNIANPTAEVWPARMSNESHPFTAAVVGMVEIDQATFYAAIGHLDVMPYIKGEWIEGWGYLDEWRLRDGRVIGISVGGTALHPSQYFLLPEYAKGGPA